MTIAHKRSSRSQTIASWSVKKVLVTLALIVGTLSSSSLYARELDSGNIADPAWGNCPITNNSCNLVQKGITSIASGTFVGHSTLQNLYLRGNQITSIESGDFAGLSSLITLSFYLNQITSIESGSFAGLSALQNLVFLSNRITSIESGDLAGLSALQTLSLRDNRITSIESDDFINVPNLQNLDLSVNEIRSIESGDFAGLMNLQSLNLRDNRITSIESDDFINVPNLQNLDLVQTCLNSEDTDIINKINNIAGNATRYDQRICVGVTYSPATSTSGSVTGSLVLYGPTSKIAALQAENPDMSIYDHIFTDNGTGLLDYTSLVDSNAYVWRSFGRGDTDDEYAYSANRTVLGTVTWIDNIAPGAPTIIAPISGTSMLADITSGVSVIFSGTAETGSLVTVSISGQTYTGITDSNGNFNIPTVLMLPVGSYTARVTATDQAGNISPESTVTIIFTAIVIPSTPTNNGGVGGGGGGGIILHKDECPQGDFTASYYDNACGSQAGTGKQHNIVGSENNTTKKPLTTTQPAAVDTLTYLDSEIYNDTIANDYCYTRQSDIFITRNKTGIFTPEEFNKALTFLYAYELTSYNDIDQFQPYDVLSREQAAKIFSNFAIHVLCRKPNTELHRNYNDIHSANDNLQSYMTLAYQLGLMKGGIDGNFRPKDTITKAEVNAILVRLLLENYLPEDTGDTRYSHYNTVSKKLNIITQDTNDNSITRQDTSLMLFRAYKNQIFELQGGSYSLKNRESFLSL